MKGPGLIQWKIPLDGRMMCMAFPNQYERTSRNKLETLRVWGLK